jgi:mono/diheme cytochrome c family protein
MERAALSLCTALAVLAALASFNAPAQVAGTSPALLDRGRYLAAAGDCAACHTAEGGKPYAGGRPVPTPFGTIYSTNITPDKDTGIGSWTADDFYRAMHDGIRRDGAHLYPAFPYPWYTRLAREDVDALKAYLDALPPARQDNKPSELPFPLSARESVGGWNWLFFDAGTYKPDPARSAQWNRGAYLVQGLGHCGACHTPKNRLGGIETAQRLQGGYGEHWYAPPLTNAPRDGLGNWSAQEIVEYLKTGSNDKSAAGGPMAEVVQHSTQYLTNGDLYAMAAYLKSQSDGADRRPVHVESDKQRLAQGQALYIDQCAGCHMAQGEGQPGGFPPLKGNAVVQARDPETLVHVILEGVHTVATREKPTGLAMPAFDWKLSDEQAAALASWLRATWGNEGDAVTAAQVHDARQHLVATSR